MLLQDKRIGNQDRNGVALVIVLAFVVLLTGLVVAYLGRTSTHRRLAQGIFSGSSADQLARSALNIVVGDLKQEITNGTPITSSNIIPQRSPAPVVGTAPAIPNLIRRSVRSDAISAPAVPSGASAVNSATDNSANGRSISLARWNSHYLAPKVNTSNDASDPIAAFIAPDWVIVTRNGPSVKTAIGSGSSALNNSSSSNAEYVIGRYAFAIYDEGGLLDINVAGYPSPTPAPTVVGRKGTIAFADLTALPTTGSSFVSNTAINRIVGWRNYATVQPSGTFPSFTFNAASTLNFSTYFQSKIKDFGGVATTVFSGRTDQALINRNQLIQLRSDIAASVNMLQYLGTFSREQNKPTGLIGTRFALGKLAEVIPNPSNPGVVKADFGLVWNADHWEYWSATGSGEQSTIPPIVGSPDFFQVLNYGRSGSSISDILTIGASLIDQYDADSTTTVIEYAGGPPPSRAYGMESLAVPTPSPAPAPPPGAVILNREFRNVGELGYAYKTTTTTLDFKAAGVDSGILDLFTYNTASVRSGITNLSTRNSSVLAAIIKGTLPTEASATGLTNAQATTAASKIVDATIAQPAIGRHDVARLAGAPTTAPFSTSEENRESIARALAEVCQTRTWGLFIDVVAQSGRYPSSATTLADFVVEGEKRYWLHIAMDRYTGEVIDQQLEEVFE